MLTRRMINEKHDPEVLVAHSGKQDVTHMGATMAGREGAAGRHLPAPIHLSLRVCVQKWPLDVQGGLDYRSKEVSGAPLCGRCGLGEQFPQ